MVVGFVTAIVLGGPRRIVETNEVQGDELIHSDRCAAIFREARRPIPVVLVPGVGGTNWFVVEQADWARD